MNVMKKAKDKKGFTLAELLIVVAIIAVLVAIAIPVFSSKLEKAALSADAANIRAAYAELMANQIDPNTATTVTKVKVQSSDLRVSENSKVLTNGSSNVDLPAESSQSGKLTKGAEYTLSVNGGKISFTPNPSN